MKRIGLLSAALAASILIGCDNNKKNDQMAANDKYKILSGSTAEERAGAQKQADAFSAIAEPDLQADTRFAAGQLQESQERWDCAIVQYEQAVRLNPKHVPSLYRMGVVMTKTRQYDKAVGWWNKYIAATGGIASGYSNLGFTYEMAGDVANAEKAYQQGLAIDPKSQPCRVNLGLMYARNNRTDEAKENLAMCLSPAEVSFNLATIYEQQGAIALAKTELKKALEQNPNMTEAQMKLATLPQD